MPFGWALSHATCPNSRISENYRAGNRLSVSISSPGLPETYRVYGARRGNVRAAMVGRKKFSVKPNWLAIMIIKDIASAVVQ